jgi:hypothetical protein
LALFFQTALTAEIAEIAEKHILASNVCGLSVLGGRTTKMALNWLCFVAVSKATISISYCNCLHYTNLAHGKLALFFHFAVATEITEATEKGGPASDFRSKAGNWLCFFVTPHSSAKVPL